MGIFRTQINVFIVFSGKIPVFPGILIYKCNKSSCNQKICYVIQVRNYKIVLCNCIFFFIKKSFNKLIPTISIHIYFCANCQLVKQLDKSKVRIIIVQLKTQSYLEQRIPKHFIRKKFRIGNFSNSSFTRILNLMYCTSYINIQKMKYSFNI